MIIGPLLNRFCRAIMGEPRAQHRMNKWMMYFWIANLVAVQVVFLFANALWQKASILYLADISVYSCIGQHYTGVVASVAGKNAGEDGPESCQDPG
jgi:hypothetical protein